MIPTKREYDAYVRANAKEMFAFICQEFDINPNLQLKIVDKETRYLGQAGVKNGVFILTMNAFRLTRFQVQSVVEYPRISGYSTIGSFGTEDWKLHTDTTLAHEMAHIAQFALFFVHRQMGHYKGIRLETNHGKLFQAVYRKVREKFINHRIDRSIRIKPTDFVVPEDFQTKKERKMNTSHPYVGKTFTLSSLGLMEVVAYYPRNHKYPIIAECVDNRKRYKLSIEMVKRSMIMREAA